MSLGVKPGNGAPNLTLIPSSSYKTYNLIAYAKLFNQSAIYANNLDSDETPNNSASHPDLSCLTLSQHFIKKNVDLQGSTMKIEA